MPRTDTGSICDKLELSIRDAEKSCDTNRLIRLEMEKEMHLRKAQGDGIMNVWDESTAQRGSSEVCSCLEATILKRHSKAPRLVLVSDGSIETSESERYCLCGAVDGHQWAPTSQCCAPSESPQSSQSDPFLSTQSDPCQISCLNKITCDGRCWTAERLRERVRELEQDMFYLHEQLELYKVPEYPDYYNIIYKGDEAVYVYKLHQDYEKGDLKVLVQ